MSKCTPFSNETIHRFPWRVSVKNEIKEGKSYDEKLSHFVGRTLFYLFQCPQSQSTNETHINEKDTENGDLEKKIDLDDADIFDEVNDNSDNEDLHRLKRLSKTHSMGNGKVFKASKNATVLKTGVPKNVQNLTIAEKDHGELVLGYNYTNVLVNLLAKFNKLNLLISFIIMLKRRTQKNGGHQSLLLKPNTW